MRVEVLDRIPVTGGVHGWRAAETVSLDPLGPGARGRPAPGSDRRSLGVRGAHRRWPPGKRAAVAAAALVIAAGSRPLTRAELGLAAIARPASSPRRWRATWPRTVCSSGCGRASSAAGTGPTGRRMTFWRRGRTRSRWSLPRGCCGRCPHVRGSSRACTRSRSTGRPRVTALVADARRVDCDAVVMAHRLAPLRNVDGAVGRRRRRCPPSRSRTRPTLRERRGRERRPRAEVRSLLQASEAA